MSVDYWKSTIKNVAILKAKENARSARRILSNKSKGHFKVGISDRNRISNSRNLITLYPLSYSLLRKRLYYLG